MKIGGNPKLLLWAMLMVLHFYTYQSITIKKWDCNPLKLSFIQQNPYFMEHTHTYTRKII